MPYISKAQRAQGGYAPGADERPPLPVPDQSRYGPPGTTDSPRYRADGVTPWPREVKSQPPIEG